MSGPPRTALYGAARTSQPRLPARSARRAVLVQCERCLATGTATLNYGNRIVSVNLPAERSGITRWMHRDCGGTFLSFDIEVGR